MANVSWLKIMEPMIVNSERVPFPGHSRSQKGMLDVWKMTGHKNGIQKPNTKQRRPLKTTGR